MDIKRRIAVAAGREPADLVLKNAQVVSVLADLIMATDVAIADGVVVGFGNYKARRQIDLKDGYLSSGLIDSHLHIESTLLTPFEFARAVVPHGTTSVIADPHEIANVMGSKGVRWMLSASEGLPLDVYIVLSSCVPASRFESSGAKLTSRDLKKLSGLPRVVGIGEVMNYPGVIAGQKDLLDKIRLIPGMRVDGHAPRLSGKELAAYIVAGIHSDHESTSAGEALEKLTDGLHIMVREGSTEKNLREVSRMVTPANSHRCFFCTDDKSALDLVRRGHIDDILRKAVRCGIPPVTALQMATNNAPYYFRLPRRKGAVAVGYVADLVVFDNLKNFDARMVFKNGRLVAKDGVLLDHHSDPTLKAPARSGSAFGRKNLLNIMRVKGLTRERLVLRAQMERARVIVIVAGQIVTREKIVPIRPRDGIVSADTRRDILKLAVIERHHATGRVGVGLVSGFGLKHGALASTVCHDSHNLICVGTNDSDMFTAANELIKIGGGFTAVAGGKVIATLPLPIAGLMSNMDANDTARTYQKIEKTARELGATLEHPFLVLSFLALSVIPELRLTDRGLLDARVFKLVPVFF